MKTKILIFSLAFTGLVLNSCKKKPGVDEVFMENSMYNPATITVSAGSTVTWTDKESVTHTVTSSSNMFDSGDMGNKKTFSFNFSTKGTYTYKCMHHSGMTGTVIVQ